MPFIGNKPTAIPLSADDLEDNIISTAKIQDNAVTPAKYIEPVPFRNIIINGDMSQAQRGTSSTSITAGNYTVDRFRYSKSGTSPTFTISQDTSVPSGQGFSKSLKLEVTTTNATNATEWGIIEQRFEGQNLQYLKKGTSSAESLTLSFWVKASKTGTYIIRLDDNDNTRQISKSYTISTADTWEKKTLTFDGDTSGTLDNDNAQSLSVEWCLYAGTDYTSGTLATSWESNTNANSYVGQVDAFDTVNNTFFLTGVQLEAGTSASDFEFLPYDVNLQRCYRYFQHHLSRPNEAYTGGFRSATSVQVGIQMFSEMRGNPSATYQGINCHDLADGNNLNASAISFGGVGGDYRTAIWTIITCASGGNSGDVAIVHGQDTESSGILGVYMDAEL